MTNMTNDATGTASAFTGRDRLEKIVHDVERGADGSIIIEDGPTALAIADYLESDNGGVTLTRLPDGRHSIGPADLPYADANLRDGVDPESGFGVDDVELPADSEPDDDVSVAIAPDAGTYDWSRLGTVRGYLNGEYDRVTLHSLLIVLLDGGVLAGDTGKVAVIADAR